MRDSTSVTSELNTSLVDLLPFFSLGTAKTHHKLPNILYCIVTQLFAYDLSMRAVR